MPKVREYLQQAADRSRALTASTASVLTPRWSLLVLTTTLIGELVGLYRVVERQMDTATIAGGDAILAPVIYDDVPT